MKETMEILKASGDFFGSLFLLMIKMGIIIGIVGYGIIKLIDFIF